MKHAIITFALTVFATCQAPAQQMRRYELKVNDFSELRVDNHIAVDHYINPDSAGIAVFDASDRQADWVLFDNNGKGKLSIQTDVDYQAGEQMPHITVYSSSLTKLVNSGDSLVRALSTISCEQFKGVLIGNGRLSVPDVQASKVEVSLHSGNGQITVQGNCTEAKLHLVGTGSILADRLKAVKVKASIVGTGQIGCDPSEAITVMGAGSGNVYYRTAPPTVKSRGVGIKHSTF